MKLDILCINIKHKKGTFLAFKNIDLDLKYLEGVVGGKATCGTRDKACCIVVDLNHEIHFSLMNYKELSHKLTSFHCWLNITKTTTSKSTPSLLKSMKS